MQSSCLSIAKMILYNIALLLKEVNRKFNKVKSSDDPLPSKLVIDEGQLNTLVDLLTDFEDNGDLVQHTYSILENYLVLSKGNPQN